LGNDDDARDALHNTMAKAWEALRRDEPDVPLRAWLFRIAHNEALSLARSRRAHRDLDATQAISARTVDETFALRQRLAELEADLAALPERQRSALVLRELCGLGHAEIAAVLATSSATARQAIYEARVGLHEAALGREMTCAAVQRALSDGDRRTRRRRRIRGHLRSCQACASFDSLLRQRPGQLAALVQPLPTATSAGVLARLVSHGGAGAGSSVAVGTTGAVGALGSLSSAVATKLVVASVVVIVGGATELGRVMDSTSPAATAAIAPSAGGPPVGGAPGRRSAPVWAIDAALASAVSTARGDRAHAAPDAHPVGGEANAPLATVAGPDDPAGVPASDATLDPGSHVGPQTATAVSDPIQAAEQRPSPLPATPPGGFEDVQAEPRPSGLPATPPGGSADVQTEPGPVSPGRPVVEPERQSPAADAGGRAASDASVEARPSRTAIDTPAPASNVRAGNERPVPPAVTDRSGDRPEGAAGEQRRPAAEPRPMAEPRSAADHSRRAEEGPPAPQRSAADPSRRAEEGPPAPQRSAADPSRRAEEGPPAPQRSAADPSRRAETGPPAPQRSAADPPRRAETGPPAPQRPAAEPPHDPSRRPAQEEGPPGPTSQARGPADNGDSRDQLRAASTSPPPKAPRPIEPAPGGDQRANGGDDTAPVPGGQPALPAQSPTAQPAPAVTRPTTNGHPSVG
jgi:RNA polymerase sigma factor (sigma-70 family)